MLEAYLDPERQRAWGVAGEAWGRSLWDVDAATPDDAYLQRVDAYREAFAEPLGQALSLLFWQLDSKVIRGRLAQDHAFLDRMLECVLQSPEVQDFAWSETRSAMERFAAGAGAGHNLMFVTLPLLESSGPYREHVRHEAEQGRTPAAARALFELTQMVVPPDEPGMLGGTRFGEEFAVLEALAFDRVSIPKVVELAAQHGVDLEGYALMDFEDLRRKQDAWAGEVRARGSTGVDACDRCGRLASAGYELKRCDKCNGPRYCSEACKEAAWEDDHREECETAAGTGTSSAAA
ncbi:hypothetical protein DFJ74DRAFT_661590 [Hyaloraphidium curvatum]|nr:hypothetical protein DFJ74DRAFT_661590 [Hyaloraphidium curvatum]